MSKNNGITSVLNKHYNDNREHFESDIESENLKTVLLKIGERTEKSEPIMIENIKPRKKRKILRNIHKGQTDTEINTILNEENQKLIELDDYFENYGKCRRLVLKEIYCSWCENGEYCKSSKELMDIINELSKQPLTITTYNEIEKIEEFKNRDKLNPNQTQELTNAFHQWVRSFIKEKSLKTQIKAFDMDRLLPNLYEDISGSLVGFFRKLIQAECQYGKEIINLNNFIIKLKSFDIKAANNTYKYWDKANFYGKIIDSYISQSCRSLESAARKKGEAFDHSAFDIKGNAKVNIYLEFREAIENADKLSLKTNIKDLLNFNNVYNQLRTTCEIIKHHIGWQQKEFELIFKKKEGIVKLINSREGKMTETKATQDGLFAVISPILFNPKKTFPQFEDQNTLESFYSRINDLHKKIDEHKSNENLSIIEISKKKIFKESFLSIKNKERNAKGKMVPKANVPQELFEKEENTPNGFAHKVFNDYYILAKDGEFKGNYLKTSNGNFAKDKYSRNIKILEKEDGKECYKWAKQKIIKKANLEIERLYNKINKGTIKDDYAELRDLAGYIWVKMRILIEEITDYSKREGLIKEISELASTISGFAYNLERSEYENQSIYLSDFLTPPQAKSSNHNFKSSAYLTTENMKTLSLAISFKSAIFNDEESTNKALVYTFNEANDELAKKFNKENKTNDKLVVLNKWEKDYELKYFDYEYWNEKAPLAYKSFTKPNIEIGVGESEFTFPLHFGANQSRKYFWNKHRKDSKGLVHDIFDPNSRLKVSSMRLIRKFNPIKTTWEYYLSLAIYRLEESKMEIDIQAKNKIVGIDIGENTLIALSTIDSNGTKVETKEKKYLITQYPVLKHIHNYKTNASNLIYSSQLTLKKENFLKPEIRLKLQNKSKSISNQAIGYITKSVLGGEIVAIEGEYLASDKQKYINEKKIHNQIVKKLAVSLPKKATEKLKNEVHYSRLFGGKEIPMEKDIANDNSAVRDIFSNTTTKLTSQICSNCGCVAGEFGDFDKLKNHFINGKTNINLKDCIKDPDNTNLRLKLNQISWSNKSEYNFLNHYKASLDILPDDSKSREYRDVVEINKYKTNIIELIKEQNLTKLMEKLNPKKSEFSPLHWRPKWYYGNIDTFRCFICNFVGECDDQAALNIARFKLFNNHFYDNKGNFDKSKFHNSYIKIEENFVKCDNEIKDFIKKIKINNVKEEYLRVFWYQTQLLKHGYDDNGNAKWNQPQQEEEQPLN